MVPETFHIGHRVSYGGDLCTVRYVGEVGGTKGEWIGVEWDDPSRGKHSGEAGGVRYFTCVSKAPTAGSFVRPNRPADKPRSFIEALRYKYVSESLSPQLANGRHGEVASLHQSQLQHRPIKISGKEVEEVGFDKIQAQLADLGELRVVLLDGLCVRRPLAPSLSTWYGSDASDIKETCPKIIELDLSRNLFEDWHEIADICAQLERLTSLRVGGNRFHTILYNSDDDREKDALAHAFRNITSLSLESTLLEWPSVLLVASQFRSLTALSIEHNEFDRLQTTPLSVTLPISLTTINLSRNSITSLDALLPLTHLPSLHTLVLKHNRIRALTSSEEAEPPLFASVTTLDLSYNAIPDFTLITSLPPSFPSLTHLRIAHNPLYTSLTSAAGKPLSPDDGYMLTLARLPALQSLNYSAVSAKDRVNAELYYLSQIAQELALSAPSPAADPQDTAAAEQRVLAQHPRWPALCAEHGRPDIPCPAAHADASATTLAARLIRVRFRVHHPARPRTWTAELPRALSVYAVAGLVGARFGLAPRALRLVWETDEWEDRGRGGARLLLRNSGVEGAGDAEWDSEEDGDGDGDADGGCGEAGEAREEGVDSGGAAALGCRPEGRAKREVTIVPGTRSWGSWVEGDEVIVRVEVLAADEEVEGD